MNMNADRRRMGAYTLLIFACLWANAHGACFCLAGAPAGCGGCGSPSCPAGQHFTSWGCTGSFGCKANCAWTPVDCVLSDFSQWAACSKTCGSGTQSRSRSVVTPAAYGGAPCGALTDTRSCNTAQCTCDTFAQTSKYSIDTDTHQISSRTNSLWSINAAGHDNGQISHDTTNRICLRVGSSLK